MSTVEFIDIFIDLIDVRRGFNWYFLWFDWRFPLILRLFTQITLELQVHLNSISIKLCI